MIMGYYMKKTYKFSRVLFLLSVMFLSLNSCGDDSAAPELDPDPNIVIEEYIIHSNWYLNNRFFQLDLPANPNNTVCDIPGRDPATFRIELQSIHLYKLLAPEESESATVQNVAAYVDSTGVFWNGAESPAPDFSDPCVYGSHWEEVYSFDFLIKPDSELIGIDLGLSLAADDVLAAVYHVVDQSGELVFTVGDRPGYDQHQQINLPNEDGLYYRMKIIKAPEQLREPFVFHYVLRNIYSLGGANFDVDYFKLSIERKDDDPNPEFDENQIPYLQIFGLDQYDAEYSPNPDGLVDLNNPSVIDLAKGLLRFPLDFPRPFNAGETAYAAYAGEGDFQWENTFLNNHQAPQLYDPEILSLDYHQFGFFNIVVTSSRLED